MARRALSLPPHRVDWLLGCHQAARSPCSTPPHLHTPQPSAAAAATWPPGGLQAPETHPRPRPHPRGGLTSSLRQARRPAQRSPPLTCLAISCQQPLSGGPRMSHCPQVQIITLRSEFAWRGPAAPAPARRGASGSALCAGGGEGRAGFSNDLVSAKPCLPTQGGDSSDMCASGHLGQGDRRTGRGSVTPCQRLSASCFVSSQRPAAPACEAGFVRGTCTSHAAIYRAHHCATTQNHPSAWCMANVPLRRGHPAPHCNGRGPTVLAQQLRVGSRQTWANSTRHTQMPCAQTGPCTPLQL